MFDVTIVGRTYRSNLEDRSKAVTESLNKFIKEYPDYNVPLSFLRKQTKTKQVDETQELLAEHLQEI